MIDPGLQGNVAIVTGINNPRGIGAAIARSLAAQDVSVFGTYVRGAIDAKAAATAAEGVGGEALYRLLVSQDAADVVATVRALGGRIEAVEADLADPDVPAWIFERAEAMFGAVDIVVNNAAHCEPDSTLPDAVKAGTPSPGGIPIVAFSAELHDRHFAVNVRAPMQLIRELARRNAERGATWGRVISISTDGAPGFAGEVSYGASKYALESVTRAAATELGPYGITANVLSLGPIQTGYIPPAAQAKIIADTPLRRVGEPEDVADAVTFLCSEQARWITGQVIYVGGGHEMR